MPAGGAGAAARDAARMSVEMVREEIVRAMRDLGNDSMLLLVEDREQRLASALGLPVHHCRDLLDAMEFARGGRHCPACAADDGEDDSDDHDVVPDPCEGDDDDECPMCYGECACADD